MSNKYTKVYGTGGIGTGIFFNMKGDETLGRDESRLAYLTDFKDFCKCHIVLHYVGVLTDADVYPIGMIGNDDAGKSLIETMQKANLKTDFVKKSDESRTMFAVCFQYPNGAGGNITASNSACDLVDKEFIESCNFVPDKNSIILSAPEVSLESRKAILQKGFDGGAFCISSFLSLESDEFISMGMVQLSNLIAINESEASAVAKCTKSKEEIVLKASEILIGLNKELTVIITVGKDGAYVIDKKGLTFVPGQKAKLVSTAGCGDALLGGTISGLIKGKNIADAVLYGRSVATLAVESADSIALNITKENYKSYGL